MRRIKAFIIFIVIFSCISIVTPNKCRPQSLFYSNLNFFWVFNQSFTASLFSNFPYLLLLSQQDSSYIKLIDSSNKSFMLPKDTSNKSKDVPLLYDGTSIRRSSQEEYKYGEEHDIQPKGYKSSIKIDSTDFNFLSRETFDSSDISYPYEMNLDTYLNLRKTRIQNSIWDSLLTQYDLSKALSGGDIARLMGQATGLTIPIPPNPLMGIFGKPEITINVNGEVNLRMGFRWDSQNLGTVSAFGQTQASPMFSQDIRVNVQGKIGDKFTLGTDWNTRQTFDYNNKFKIAYDGYDDDIVKLVEVGNVTLPLQSSLINGGQALFGVRADFQFGPLFLKALFSQKRGETKYVDVRGGTSKQPFQIRAYDYAKNHFFLDTAYKQVYRDYFKYSTPVIPQNASSLRVKGDIEVYESSNDVRDVLSASAVAFADLAPVKLKQGAKYPDAMKHAIIVAGITESGNFLRLDTTRYRIDLNLGTLTIYNLRPDRTYAVAYRTEGPSNISEDDDYYGTMSSVVGTKDTLILKLIYRANLQPAFKSLWNRQMKNIYSINATNVNTQDTKIGVWYINQNNDSTDILQGAPDKLVTIMGVDRVNNSTGSPPPDAQFDVSPPFFDSRFGEITFPSPEPFRQGLRDYFASSRVNNPDLAEQYVFNEVYDTTYDVARRNTARDRFIISGEVSGRSTNRLSLGAFNLAPGSVKVSLDGRLLREFEDYIVDYYSGTLTLRNPMAALPNANLKIQYEQNDIFNISTRTLTGIRADYRLIKNRRIDAGLGMTLMHYDQSAIIDRVRLGEEPVSNSMLGFDARLLWDTPWMTRLLDAIPFYDTKAPSSMNVRGEWAMMMPNPNKRTSTVTSDNNEPVVYIDDFEGAQRYISLGLNPTQWSHSSQPVDSLIAVDDTTAAKFRGKMFWYQYFIPRVPIKEVYPNRSIQLGRQNLSPLELDFNPDMRGIYNRNPEFLDKLNPKYDSLNTFSSKPENRPKIWSGMMRLFSSFNTNFDTENIEYIEIMMKLDVQEVGAHMYIDLGQISEDVIPNRKLDTEDGSTPANPLPNNIIDPGEDNGLDTLNQIREQAGYPNPLNLETDPARDDYRFDFGKDDQTRVPSDFTNYNNYEGNATVSELGQFPDTEILNKNNGQTIALDNSYFSYEVTLIPNPKVNPQIVGGGSNGWFLYRIPIRKPSMRVGNPSFSNIQYIRVWFKGGQIQAKIADWRLVGAQWQRISNFQSNVSPDDSVMQIAFVNREENAGDPDFYDMPPGVQPPRQLNNPDPTQDIYLNEQSLSVSVRNLRYGDERMAVKIFRPLDIFSYKRLKFFIHGDGSMPENYVKGSIPKGEAFLRFGTDSANYYEFRTPLIHPTIDGGWQDLDVDMADLTSIKARRDSLQIYERVPYPVKNNPNARFYIKGNPILTRIQFFGVGISNPTARFPNELTTTLWIDELRLISPENSNDWAGVTSMDVKLADLGSVNASFARTMPNFHKLEDRFGDRINTTNWSVTVQGGLEKFAPQSFTGMKLPISYTHSEFMQMPQYVANNDINLDGAANAIEDSLRRTPGYTAQQAANEANAFRARSQTLKVQDSWALQGVQLGIPIASWLVRETINRVTFGYSYSQEFERSPVVSERFNWIWRLTSQYSVNLPKILEVQPMKWASEIPLLNTYSDLKLNFLPASLSAVLNMQRRRATEQSRFLPFPSPVFRDFSVQRTGQFSWKVSENGFLNPTIDYNVTTNSTLVPWELDENGKQRTGSQLASEILFNNGKLIEFGKNSFHTQMITINFKPRIPNVANITNYLDMTGAFSTNYTWVNPLQPDPAIADIAKSASFQNTIRYNTGFRLRALSDMWFGIADQRKSPGRVPQDTTPSSIMKSIKKTLKTIFLDFDKIDFTFNQTNNANNPGVFGSTGLDNLWSRGLTFRNGLDGLGPSLAYQLGLVTDPHGGFSMHGSNKFPFFGFSTYTGLRPPNAVLQDNFSQQSTLQINTSRPLWEGATLDLKWQTTLGYNRNQTVLTDSLGRPTFTNIVAMQSFQRTFLAFPKFFGFNLFGKTIEDVIKLYNQRKAEIVANSKDEVTKNQALQTALAESFHDGLELFSIFKGAAGKFLPAINWGIRWEGIEKWGIWGGIAKRVSLEHIYQSQYQENAQITDNGRVVQGQQIQYGFQPLVGVTFGFDEKKLKGLLTATLRWNSTNSFQLQSSNRSTIAQQGTEEISLQGSYTLRGWDFPLLGFTFKNDLEFSLLASFKSNKRATYDILDSSSYQNNSAGRKLDGNTQITIEPRARYSMSNRVTASFFFRYEGTKTEGAAQPGFSTYQVGLDLRITISGGR